MPQNRLFAWGLFLVCSLFVVGQIGLAAELVVSPEPSDSPIFAPPPTAPQPLPSPAAMAMASDTDRSAGGVLAQVVAQQALDGFNCPSCGHYDCTSCATCSRCGGRRGVWANRIKPCLQRSHWGYSDRFCEPAFGSCVAAAMSKQISNGIAAQMVLYRYDFCACSQGGGGELNAHGRRRLEDISKVVRYSGTPIVIESMPGLPEVDAARRAHVIETLAQWRSEIGPEMVVVGRPTAAGMAGEEGYVIHDNMLQNTKSQGGSLGSSGMSSGVMGGVGAASGGQ